MPYREWEGVAADILSATGLVDCDDVDAFVLAEACGLRVRHRRGPARLTGDDIFVDLGGRETRQHFEVAHEVGHFALRRARELDTEQASDYVAAALLLPRERYTRDIWSCSWDLAELRLRYPHVAWSVLARRITHVTSAVALTWDHGKCVSRVESPWHWRPRFVPTEEEAASADACLESGAAQRLELGGTWPIFERPWRRVVTILRGDSRTTVDAMRRVAFARLRVHAFDALR